MNLADDGLVQLEERLAVRRHVASSQRQRAPADFGAESLFDALLERQRKRARA